MFVVCLTLSWCSDSGSVTVDGQLAAVGIKPETIRAAGRSLLGSCLKLEFGINYCRMSLVAEGCKSGTSNMLWSKAADLVTLQLRESMHDLDGKAKPWLSSRRQRLSWLSLAVEVFNFIIRLVSSWFNVTIRSDFPIAARPVGWMRASIYQNCSSLRSFVCSWNRSRVFQRSFSPPHNVTLAWKWFADVP